MDSCSLLLEKLYLENPFSHDPKIISIKDGKREKESSDEPTCRCHQNPFIGALGIQQPVILGEPQIDQ